MKVTIDSSEPLDQALRVLGAMYDVTLSVSSGPAEGREPSANDHGPESSNGRKPGQKGRTRQQSQRGRKKSSSGGRRGARTRVSTAELRSWARDNGYTVAERGRLPAEIAAAYNAAKKG